jgi:hypothetical protein
MIWVITLKTKATAFSVITRHVPSFRNPCLGRRNRIHCKNW